MEADGDLSQSQLPPMGLPDIGLAGIAALSQQVVEIAMASDPGEHTLKGQELESLKEKFQQQALRMAPCPSQAALLAVLSQTGISASTLETDMLVLLTKKVGTMAEAASTRAADTASVRLGLQNIEKVFGPIWDLEEVEPNQESGSIVGEGFQPQELGRFSPQQLQAVKKMGAGLKAQFMQLVEDEKVVSQGTTELASMFVALKALYEIKGVQATAQPAANTESA